MLATASALVFSLVLSAVTPGAGADEVTVSSNALRTGWDPSESALTPSAVSSGGFGQLFSTAVNGQVYAQPLVIGSTVVVATENDWVYGLNSTTGAVQWSTSLGTPWAIGSICNDLTPSVGVTSTPVYDSASGAVYLVAATVVNSVVGYRLFGVNPQTGAITESVAIGGSPSNDSSITFNAGQQWQRPGLLLMNGWVYAGFASHCDGTPFDGFIAGVNVSTHAKTLWSDETGVTDDEAGIWQGGGGLMSDGSGRIFFVSGNGVSPVAGPGTSPPGQLAESVVRLGVQANGSLAAQDFFSPKNATMLDSQDLDFGSGGPVSLPFGTSSYPDLMVAIGKYGRFYLLNQDSLGGSQQGPNGSDASLRIICCFAGEWGHPAAFADTASLTSSNSAAANDFLYYVGNTDYLREMKWAYAAGGIPVLHTVATSSIKFGYTSGSPVVTSYGTSASSAIVWAVGATGSSGAGGTLYAYRAVPPSTCTSGSPCTLSPLWSAPIGTASKFTVPATDSGHVYVGTRDGHVLGFGLGAASGLSPSSGSVGPVGSVGSVGSFGSVPVGTSAGRDLTVTATADVTVTGVTAGTGSFRSGQVTETLAGGGPGAPVTFPVSLSAGDALHVPVSFTPTTPGGVAGAVSLLVSSARLPAVNVPLYGDGTQPGLFPSTGSLSFTLVKGSSVSNVPVGITAQATMQITNGGTSPQTVTAVTRPGGPFTADLPAPGTVIEPGQSITVQATFAPSRAGRASSSFTVAGNDGLAATVRLGGTGVPAISKLRVSPGGVNFGSVPVGGKATAVVHITDTGNQPATVTAVTAPGRPFSIRYPVVVGLAVNAGDDLTITLTFRPVRPGRSADEYRLTWSDRSGRHTIVVPVRGVGA
jgi:hypothetical protein